MDIKDIKEYRYIRMKADRLRDEAAFLSRAKSLADLRQQVLDQADVCDAECLALDRYIQRLPEPKRSIIQLSYCKGVNPQDVAEALGLKYKNMRYQREVALKMLAQM